MFAKLAKTKKEAKAKVLKAAVSQAEDGGKKAVIKPSSQLKHKQNKPKVVASGKKIVNRTPEPNSRTKKTDDGYNLYTEEELGLGDVGNTPDCPFDCECCT